MLAIAAGGSFTNTLNSSLLVYMVSEPAALTQIYGRNLELRLLVELRGIIPVHLGFFHPHKYILRTLFPLIQSSSDAAASASGRFTVLNSCVLMTVYI